MKAKSQNIIQLIKEDHKDLKAGIKVLTSEKSSEAEKKKALKSFLLNLKLHAKAEEMSLYENTVNNEDTRSEVLEGYEEHSLADLLGSQLEKSGFEHAWSDKIAAKAKVLAELVKHHVQEEEEEMLVDLKESTEREELILLGELYTQNYKQLKKELTESKKVSTGSNRKANRGEEKAMRTEKPVSQSAF